MPRQLSHESIKHGMILKFLWKKLAQINMGTKLVGTLCTLRAERVRNELGNTNIRKAKL